MTTASKLRSFHLRKYADALDDIAAAVSGDDLYDRPTRTMTDSQTDSHAATVFNMPRAMVRKRRTVLGRILRRLGIQ